MTRIRIPNFTPRAYQLNILRALEKPRARAVAVWHRRGGKDLTLGHGTCAAAHRRKGAYWHVFPTEIQGRKAIWEGFTKDGQRIMEQIFPKEIRKSPKEFLPKAEMVVELKCGSLWRLLGSDKISSVGAGPVGVVMSEYSLQKPSAWNYIRPMLDENDGWAAFPYTPRGHNHGKQLFDMAMENPEWFCERLTLKDTGAYDYETTIANARASGMPEALIQQEYMCDFEAALVGSVYGDLLNALPQAPIDDGTSGVYTSWDLGFSDATAIWFWRLVAGRVEFIDYLENHGKPLSFYFDELDRRGYQYRKHWLPHDANQHTLASTVSILDQCVARWGPSMVAIGPSLSFMDGIQAGRWLLEKGTRFGPKCAEGLEALKLYHYEYDEDRKSYGMKPEHDWTSHCGDAFRYTACVVRVSEMLEPKPEEKPAPIIIKPAQPTFNELVALNARKAGPRRI